MQTRLLHQLAPFLIASGIPLALMSCSSGDDDSSKGTGGTGTAAGGGAGKGGTGTGGTGGSTGGTGTGGSSGGTGGSATGGTGTGGTGTGGTGGSATGGTGGGSGGAATGGSGGKAMAGSGGMGGKAMAGAGGTNGGASSGGAPSGGMGGKASGGASSGGASGASGTAGGTGGNFTLVSTDVMDGAKFDGKFTCNGGTIGGGINPELHWSGSPAGAMSFAITFIDTTLGADNSMGQHWAMYNIPSTVMEIAQGALTKTLMGDISMAKQATPLNNGFLAPCAGSLKNGMDDNYEFTIYALSTASLASAGTSVASVLQALGILNSSGKLTNPPMLNSAVLGSAVLHAHAGLKGQ